MKALFYALLFLIGVEQQPSDYNDSYNQNEKQHEVKPKKKKKEGNTKSKDEDVAINVNVTNSKTYFLTQKISFMKNPINSLSLSKDEDVI